MEYTSRPIISTAGPLIDYRRAAHILNPSALRPNPMGCLACAVPVEPLPAIEE